MDDLVSLEEQLSQARDKEHLWKTLVQHPSFEAFQEELTKINEVAKGVVMGSPLGMDSNVYAQEFFKGEFAGVEKALKFPQEQYEAAKREVSMLTVKVENYHEAEADSKPAASRVDTRDNFGV